MEINRKRVAKRLASGLVAGALALGGLAISGSSVSAKTPVAGSSPVATDGRVGGADRYETATKAADGFLARRGSLNTWNAVVVASGSNFPDALAASGLAGALNAPILLLPSNGSMPESVKEWALSRRVQIQTNSAAGVPFTVYVVGGEAAVPQTGIDTLMSVITKDDATPAVSKRVSGADRAATAQAVATEKNAAGANLVLSPAKPVFIVNDSSFADALSIAPYAFNSASPILLSSATSMSAATTAVLTQYRLLGGNNIVILGGKTAISSAVEEALVTMGFAYANITRISGADRYETSVAVADWVAAASANFDNSEVVFASGESFADGLAGAPWAGFGAANAARALVLVQPNALPSAVSEWVAGLSLVAFPENMFVLGGTSAVSAAVPTAVTTAATALNTTSELTCVENATGTLVTLSIPGNITGATVSGVPSLGNEAALINNNQLTVNGSPSTAAAGQMDVTAPLGFSVITGKTTGTLTVAVGALSAAGNVITWPGLNEIANTAVKRVIAGASCTVADDAVPPAVLSIDARVPGAGAETGVFYVTFSEVVSGFAAADLASSNTDVDGFTVTQVGASATWKVAQTDGGIAEALAAGDTITINANGVSDASGNNGPAVNATKTINAITDADVSAPTLTASMTCTQGAEVTLINKAGGTLTMTADGVYGPQGVNGNLYTFKVTNLRGQLIPKVTVDDTAKTIVLTADLAYSTENDVDKAMANEGIIGWSFDDTAGPATPMAAAQANVTAGTYATAGSTAGVQSCSTTVTASENIQSAAALTAATVVAGVQYAGLGAITMSTTAGNTKFSIAAITTIPVPVATGTVAITLSGAVKDVAGNSSLVGIAV